MAIQSEIFDTSFNVRSFVSTKHIATKQHMAVWLYNIANNEWEQLSVNLFELINNSAVLTTAPDTGVYSKIEIRVADEPNELLTTISDIAIVASSITDVQEVAGSIEDVNNVSDGMGLIYVVLQNMGNIDINAVHIDSIVEVSEHIGQVTGVAYNTDRINIVANNINPINVDAQNIEYIKSVANALTSGGSSSGGQYYGNGVIKAVSYLSNSTVTNETITVVNGTNAFAVDNITIADGSEIIVEDGAVFKVL